MILDVEESKELCDWLMERGLGLGETAHFLCDLGCGDTFAIALMKVFKHRQNLMEKLHAKKPIPDWGNPITP